MPLVPALGRKGLSAQEIAMPETQTLSLPTVPRVVFSAAPPATAATTAAAASIPALVLVLLAALLLSLIAACADAGKLPRQFVAEWQEARLLFIADGGGARVRVFSLAALAPVPLGELRPQARSGVSDLALDAQRGELWVLGSEQLELFDARRRQSLGRWTLPAATVAALRVDGKGVLLLAADGRRLGHCAGESGVLRLSAVAGGALP